jgi:hypothetical protein
MFNKKANSMVSLISTQAGLISYLAQGQQVNYLHFWGHTQKAELTDKSCLSQWFIAPFHLDGQRYLTAEHYMMAQKARLFKDDAKLSEILASTTPKAAKQLGREVQNFDEALWNQHCFAYVVEGNGGKFSQNPALKDFLLSTANQVLVEASPYDRIWGIGMGVSHPDANYPERWRGQNLLGFALMQVRAQLRSSNN